MVVVTISDIISLVGIGILILAIIVVGILYLLEEYQWKRKWKKLDKEK